MIEKIESLEVANSIGINDIHTGVQSKNKGTL